VQEVKTGAGAKLLGPLGELLIKSLEGHGIVTDYRDPGLKVRRSDDAGRTYHENVPLGVLIARELDKPLPQGNARVPRSTILPPDASLTNERKNPLFSDPWDRGGGSGARGLPISPQGRGIGQRTGIPDRDPGGVLGDVQIDHKDFTSK
jgi:hypothetical protein